MSPDRFLVRPLDQGAERGALDPEKVAALILDCSHLTGAESALARVRSALAGVPVLLVDPAVGDDCDAGMTHAEAEDSIARPLDPRVLERRLRLLIEVGQSRRALTQANRALEVSVGGACISDASVPGFPLVYVSPSFERLTGYSSEECLGRNCNFLQGVDTDPEAVARLRDAARYGRPTRVVLQNYRKNGSPFWNEVVLKPLFDEQGQLRWIVGTQHDVTATVEAQAEIGRMNTMIAERQQFTSAILDGIHAAIVTTDAFNRVAFINRTASATLGISAEQCLGRSVVNMLQLPPEGREALEKKRGQVTRFSYSYRHPDGTTLDIGLSISRAEGESLQLGHFITFRDIAMSRQLEMDDRRVERLAAMGTMATGFAHEVRNPLAVLRILGEGLEAEIDPNDSRHEYLSRMMEQLDRMERLVKTSLQFGRPDPPRRSRRAPAAIAHAALEALLPRTKSLGPIHTRIEAGLPEVCVDEGQIIQALIILLNNALDATESPQRVLLSVRHSQEAERVNTAGKDEVRFEVIDDGPGIPKYMITRIFDPFFTTKQGGTGLGLSIAQQLIHENRGQLDVSSVLGKGTTFALVIPRLLT